ncbi:MAG TPA: cytochrome c3 family protein [Candidatus Acidoferrales bacterium]|nr:cytochrome c3 family protein [Candidatus Acidoferrales bacterium]
MTSRMQYRGAAAGGASLTALIALGVLLSSPPSLRAQNKNTCIDCHKQLDPPLGIDPARYAASIHGQKGIRCTACHGGDDSSDDIDKSMGKGAGFRGNIDRAKIPALCASCHSNAAYMRGFNPSVRTDEFSQYQTSVHGKLLAKGDTWVAVCTDCHTAHEVYAPNDPRSSVYPTNVAQTCSRCHASAAYMKRYKIPVNQFALYSTSVHHAALAGGDLSAPTCTTCHGSHGAAPPGVPSVENVCSTCHVFQAQLFDAGPHKDAFAAMSLPSCITCHSNHGIQHPTDAMIGAGPQAVCVKCHSAGEPGAIAAAAMHGQLAKLDAAIARSDDILGQAERAGMEVSAAKLAQGDAREDLIKARVAIHQVQPQAVDQDVQAGLEVTGKTWQAGLAALAERRYRREGLLVSLVAIAWVLIALGLLIRKIESKGTGTTKET